MDKEIVRSQFRHTTISRVVDVIIKDAENYEIAKAENEGIYSIQIWKIEPIEDEGSFVYYDRVEDRDNDYDLLVGIVEIV